MLRGRGRLRGQDLGRGVDETGDFDCSYNELTSLEGAPTTVNGHFNCIENDLTSLDGCPKKVDGDFDISKGTGFTEDQIRAVCDVIGVVNIS